MVKYLKGGFLFFFAGNKSNLDLKSPLMTEEIA